MIWPAVCAARVPKSPDDPPCRPEGLRAVGDDETGDGKLRERQTHVPDQALVAHRHAFEVTLRDEGDLAPEALGVPVGQGLPVDVDVAVAGCAEAICL